MLHLNDIWCYDSIHSKMKQNLKQNVDISGKQLTKRVDARHLSITSTTTVSWLSKAKCSK